MHFDDLVGSSRDEDLQFSGLVKWTVEQSEQALMRDVWPVLGRVFLQFVGDIVSMVVTV